jgi:hypothetical protein
LGVRRAIYSLTKQKAAAQRVGAGRSIFIKHPVDCDDEESLEERRGRTVLRTAFGRPGPIVIMVLPTEIQPDSLNVLL